MHLVCVRRGSERTGFCSYDAANVSVKARRPSVAHPEYNRQCQCSGELFTMTCRDYGFFFFRKFSVGDKSPYFKLCEEHERRA